MAHTEKELAALKDRARLATARAAAAAPAARPSAAVSARLKRAREPPRSAKGTGSVFRHLTLALATTVYAQARASVAPASSESVAVVQDAPTTGYDCNVLSDPSSSCMLPYPDDFFLSTTWNAAAHKSLLFRNSSLPVSDSGDVIDPVAGGFDALEGFSPLGPYSAYFSGLSLELSGLPRLWSISAALSGNVVLINTRTSEPMAVWVELDHSGDSATDPTPYERALLLWPARRLDDATTYIAAFRGLVDDSGVPIASSDGFSALKYNRSTSSPAVEASRPRFESIFEALEAAPVSWPRHNLTLAWSFTTNTQADLTRRMLHMRDDAFARVASTGVKYSIGEIENEPSTGVARRVHGQVFVPTYLPDDAIPSLGSHLILDPATGLPAFQSLTPYDFELVIPESIANGSMAPRGVLQYGHGLFGSHGEVENDYLSAQANAHGWVLAATDWIGLSEYDEATVVVMLAENFTLFRLVPDRLHQGMLNALMLMRMLAPGQPFLDEACLKFPSAPATGVISLNASQRFYTGNSQGGIMGSVYMAASTDVVLGVCGVGGGPYALLLPRSSDFADLFILLKLRYPRSLDRILTIALFQSLWDRMDPSGWVGYLTAPSGAAGGPGLLPGTPSHRAVFHYGLGDRQVTWLGQHAVALSAGAVMFASNVREGNESLAQFSFVADDAVLQTGNAIVGFDYGFPQVPFINVPPSSSAPDAHECPRRTLAAQAQMARFFETGDIVNTCGGACKLSPPNGCG